MRVVREEQPGYGAAVHAGLTAARTELVAVLDGDGSLDPQTVVPLVAAVATGTADLAVGRRCPAQRGVWPWHARVGNAAVLRWLRYRTGLAVRDIAPMRVARRADLLALNVEDRRFGYPVELLVRAQAAGWHIVEYDIPYHRRAAGTSSKVSGSLIGTLRAVRDFAKVLP